MSIRAHEGDRSDPATMDGCFADHAVGYNTLWLAHIKMGNGSYQNIQVKDASGIRQGDLVQMDSNGNIPRIQ